MLKSIQLENWAELKTLTGTAEHVPEAVLSLLTDDKDEFELAYWKLENHVVVQGDLFDSAAVLPKYLEEVVLKARYKPGVLELLFQIGNGVSTNAELEEVCFNEVVSALGKLLVHREIIEAGLNEIIKRDLDDLMEIRKERGNGT